MKICDFCPNPDTCEKAGECGRGAIYPEVCGACNGTGWVPRDPDIGTDQECFCCKE